MNDNCSCNPSARFYYSYLVQNGGSHQMSLLYYYLDLAIEFFSSQFCIQVLYPFFALFFIASTPCLFRLFFSWRS